MLSLLRRLGGKAAPATAPSPDAVREEAPRIVSLEGLEPFPFQASVDGSGFPTPDWDKVGDWLRTLPTPQQQEQGWAACERAWLLHLRDALGAGFELRESTGAIVVSSLEPKLARYTLDFMDRTLKRIVHVLEGVAEVPPWGKDILIVFDDQDSYYAYASRFYPERGEFAFSSGMHISRGCSHYITTKSDLRTIEPVIAHEMAHGCVAHLPLPLWLNEGLAVNTEHRLAGTGGALFTPQEMHQKHLKFWGKPEIQEFWSGRSFQRPDDGNMLSYDLARILVEQLSRNWERFAAFVNAASFEDGGASSAREHLNTTLGALLGALLDRQDVAACEPRPTDWDSPAEHVPAKLPIATR